MLKERTMSAPYKNQLKHVEKKIYKNVSDLRIYLEEYIKWVQKCK